MTTGRQREHGFTLVELMVALTGGLFVSIAVFMLAKQSTQIYQAEARVSNATMGSVVGFERLRTDISRAGFMTTPNIQRDPKLCGRVDASWPSNIQRLQSVYVARVAPGPGRLAAAGIVPDELVLAGNYSSTDQFDAARYDDAGGQAIFTLQTKSFALERLRYADITDVADARRLMDAAFPPGRILRVVDQAGREQYTSIVKTQVISLDEPQVVVLSGNPAILRRSSNHDTNCGLEGIGVAQLNVVNLIHYHLVAVDPTSNLGKRYAPLFSTGGVVPLSDAGRTELVREELDAEGEAIDGTEEIVAEFAVDLAFGVTVAEIGSKAGNDIDQLRTIAPGTPGQIAKWVGKINNSAVMNLDETGPQFVRALRARLSVRSREADRKANITAGPAVAAGLYRFDTGNGFARVRTVQTDVALHSQMGATWPK